MYFKIGEREKREKNQYRGESMIENKNKKSEVFRMILERFLDMETGEVLLENEIQYAKEEQEKIKLNKLIVDEMLLNSKQLDDLDVNMLYAWCRITKEINSYGQIRLMGAFRDRNTERKMIEDITITGYAMRVLDRSHAFSGMLKSNHKTFITTWKMLFEDIECTARATQIKLKKFLTDNHIIREFKTGGADGKLVNRLILNPFLFRSATHSSQIAITVFQDFIREGSNMSCYPIRWLQALGMVNEY